MTYLKKSQNLKKLKVINKLSESILKTNKKLIGVPVDASSVKRNVKAIISTPDRRHPRHQSARDAQRSSARPSLKRLAKCQSDGATLVSEQSTIETDAQRRRLIENLRQALDILKRDSPRDEPSGEALQVGKMTKFWRKENFLDEISDTKRFEHTRFEILVR